MTVSDSEPIRRPRAWQRLIESAYLAAMNFALRWPGHDLRIVLLRSLGGWTIGSHTSIGRGCHITCHGRVSIGSRCNINQGVWLDGRGGLSIGNDSEIANGVKVLTAGHDPRSDDFRYVTSSTTLGSRVWLATDVMVMPGVTMGDGSVAAARSVVAHDVQPLFIVAGVPAKQIGVRPKSAQTQHHPYRRFWH